MKRHNPSRWSVLPIALTLLACAPTPSTTPPAQAPTQAPTEAEPPMTAELPIPNDLDLSSAGRRAVQELGNAKSFGGWAVGAGATPVPAVAALRTLLAEPQAADALRVVVEHGTLAGQLMAVSGLYYADPAGFEAALNPYRGSRDTVLVRSNGCMMMETPTPVAELVDTEGAMNLDGPDDTFAAWANRNPDTKTVVFDIAHGGYPHELRGQSQRR